MVRTLAFLLVAFSGAAEALESVTLQLKWRHQFQFAGYYAAIEKGYYRDSGLDVRLAEATTSTNVVDEVVSGRAQYGVGTSELLLARSKAPVIAIAVIFQHSPLILLAREDKIKNLHELAGREVMLEAHAEELLAYLRKEGLPKELLRILPHGQGVRDLIDGKVAAMSAYSTTEPFLVRQAGLRTIEFSPRAVGIDFYGDNLFTSQQEFKQHPNRVRAFRTASLRGWEYAMSHPDEIISLIGARYNSQGLGQDMLAFEASRTAQLMQTDLVEIGYMNPGRWQHIANVYAELNMQPGGKLPEDFLYNTGPQQLPEWLTPTAILVTITILVLALLAQRNISLSRQMQREIEAHKEAHRQLAKSEEHSRFMLENSADTLWEIDAEFRFTYMSQADFRVRGFKASEVVGQSMLTVLTPDSARTVQEQIALRVQAERKGEANSPMRLEFEMYCKDGSTVWTETQALPVRDAKGKVIGAQGVTRDISEHKRHRIEQQQTNEKLALQLREIQGLHQLLQEQTIRDGLTGLFNRRYLDETLPREMSRAKRDGYPLAVMMIDIDHFKQINDTYGHAGGDEALRALAAIFRQSAREGDIACRYGGEEFAIMLPRMSIEAALARAEKWRLGIESTQVQHGDLKIHFTISAGVAGYPDHASDYETLIERADLALYASKNSGRNRITRFESPIRSS
jgi:diguanylate cyclase (GGDEF)-like protein/PAS domain S-box-containing protein